VVLGSQNKKSFLNVQYLYNEHDKRCQKIKARIYLLVVDGVVTGKGKSRT